MAKVKITVKGEPGAITFRSFVSVMNNMLYMLGDYDAALSGEPDGSLEWVVTTLAAGSLCLEAESHSLFADRDVGPDVAARFVKGWWQIEHEGRTPPLLSRQGMSKARNILRLVGRGGMTGLEVSSASEEADISARAAANIEGLLKVKFRSIGSVEGRIETISIHGQPRFIMYHGRTHKAVTCRAPEDKLLDMVPTSMMGKRVSVRGVIHSNVKGEPMYVDPDNIRVLRAEEDLPSRASLRGSDPNFTGEMTTEQYLRSIRNG